MKTQQMPYTNQQFTSHSFGAVDERGRVIGAEVWTGEVDYVPFVPTPVETGYNTPAGHYFAFRPSATRNGKPYGAAQYVRIFSTQAERDAAVAAYLKSARKRAGASEVAAAAPEATKPSRFKTAAQAARAQAFEAKRAAQAARHAAPATVEEAPIAAPARSEARPVLTVLDALEVLADANADEASINAALALLA
jgi:hypothetical protein